LPGLSPTLVTALILFTRALNSVENNIDLLLLDHSLEYCTHSAKLALIQAIASVQQSTHKAKCTLWPFLQSMFHLYMHMHYKIDFSIS